MKKKIWGLLLTGALSLVMGISALASDESQKVIETQNTAEMYTGTYTGWKNDGTWDYYYKNGEMMAECVCIIDGDGYAFDEKGRLVVNQVYSIIPSDRYSYKSYWAGENGKLLTGWKHDPDGDWHFFSRENYSMYHDELFEDGGNLYYAGWGGVLLVSDSIYYEGTLYEADANGVLTVKENVPDGWKMMDGSWHYFENGEMIVRRRMTIDGKDYYFDSDGAMLTGIFYYYDIVTEEEGHVYAEKDGHIVDYENQWMYDGNYWHYFKEDGLFADKEFLMISGKTYYFDDYSNMRTGSFMVRDKNINVYVYYTADLNGAVHGYSETGWVYAEENWYYYKTKDTVVKNEFYTIDGKMYYFNEYGQMQSGCFQVYDSEKDVYTYYLADKNGAILTGKGWKYVDLSFYYTDADGKVFTEQWVENHYYVDSEGKMLVGTYYIDGNTYYFDNSGYCREKLNEKKAYTGWKLVDGYWYYYDENGEPFHGLLDETYYIQNGEMAADSFVEMDGNIYYFKYDGRMVKNGWYAVYEDDSDEKSWIYADEFGKLIQNRWETIAGCRYYFRDYTAVKGVVEIDGQGEIFDENCAWISNSSAGWNKIEECWYYFNQDGTLLKDVEKAEIGENTFYFENDGKLRCDEIVIDGQYIYYLDEGGYRQPFAGWKYVKAKWYYSQRKMPIDGLNYIDGIEYMFDEGEMMTGKVYVEYWGGYYFFNASGVCQDVEEYEDWNPRVKKGWFTEGKNWYYYINGSTVNNRICNIGGVNYAFDEQGVMRTGIYQDLLFAENGALVCNSWCKMNGVWYYADATGRYVYGQRTIDGRTYWFDDYGRLIK